MVGVAKMMQFGKQCVPSLESGVEETNLSMMDRSVRKKVGPVPSDWPCHGRCTPSGVCGALLVSNAASSGLNLDEGRRAS